jgi:hypothetical protein
MQYVLRPLLQELSPLRLLHHELLLLHPLQTLPLHLQQHVLSDKSRLLPYMQQQLDSVYAPLLLGLPLVKL